jgi:hypothetical protein
MTWLILLMPLIVQAVPVVYKDIKDHFNEKAKKTEVPKEENKP